MAKIDSDQIRTFLNSVGKRYPSATQLYLIGGCALCLLGSPRPTLDIDYVGDDLSQDGLQTVMEEIAHEMGLEVEAVPIERFTPVPADGHRRSVPLGTFGNLTVYIFDPRSIALSKIDRGFDTDLDDVVFLIQRGLITWEEIERLTQEALPRAREFDIVPADMLAHLQTVRDRLK